MIKLNENGSKLYQLWEQHYYEELDRLRVELNDPTYWQGWCVIDNGRYLKTLEDEVGLLIFGYADCLPGYFEEWRDEYGDDPRFFIDADGVGYTLTQVEQACVPYYDDYWEEN